MGYDVVFFFLFISILFLFDIILNLLSSPSYHLMNGILVHFADNWQELVQRIKSKGMRPGVALKPGTSVEEVYPLV